jgi:hypothetical protein
MLIQNKSPHSRAGADGEKIVICFFHPDYTVGFGITPNLQP